MCDWFSFNKRVVIFKGIFHIHDLTFIKSPQYAELVRAAFINAFDHGVEELLVAAEH